MVTLWAIYLVAVNLALNLPLTQRQLNALQPDSFAISWERGWSLYPLRVDLRGFTTDGQTPTQQWQADASSVGASVSLPSLLRGELRVQNLDLADLMVRLRPRPTPEQDFADLKAFFPVIRGRDPESPAEPAPPESDAALLLVVENIHLSGEHEFWVSHIRGTLTGDLRGTLSFDAAQVLTVEDREGHVELNMDGERVLVPDAMLGSDTLNVGVKGLADASVREGIVYVRWHDITGALMVKGDERHFDLVNARPEFDAYAPGHRALALSRDARRTPDPAATQTEEPTDPARSAGDHHRPAARVREAPAESDDPFVWGD